MPAKKKPTVASIVIGLIVLGVAGYFGIDLTGSKTDEGTRTSERSSASETKTPPGTTRTASNDIATSNTSQPTRSAGTPTTAPKPTLSADLRDAIRNRKSEVMVTLVAEVVKVLPDDNEGSRHQRLLLELPEYVGDVDTVLIAHNIDLAPRVPTTEGDILTVRGQYEWNDRGGVIHWTHHDPKQWREGGWIELDGERYE